MRDKDNQEYSSLSMQSPRVVEENSTPITTRNLTPIPPERVEELKTLFGLSQVQLDTLTDQQSPQTQRVAELLRAAQGELEAQGAQASPRFDYNQQQSLVWPGIQSQQQVVNVEAPVLPLGLPAFPPLEKPVSPVRRRVQKCAAPSTGVRS